MLDAGPVLRRVWEIAEAMPTADPNRASVRAALRVALDELANGQKVFFRSLVHRKDVAGGQALRALIMKAQAE